MNSAPSPDNPAWVELTDKFIVAGLPLPPIPERLRVQLRAEHDWCWSTRPIDPFDMYAFDNPNLTETRFFYDVLLDQVADYAAVSHAGYGINSYGLNFHLVYDRLAILMQVGWGGHLMDNADRARELAGYWARVAELLDTPAHPDTPPEQRLVVVFSAFRLISGCSWTTRPATNFDLAVGVEAVRRENPFDVAVRLWSQPASDGPPS